MNRRKMNISLLNKRILLTVANMLIFLLVAYIAFWLIVAFKLRNATEHALRFGIIKYLDVRYVGRASISGFPLCFDINFDNLSFKTNVGFSMLGTFDNLKVKMNLLSNKISLYAKDGKNNKLVINVPQMIRDKLNLDNENIEINGMPQGMLILNKSLAYALGGKIAHFIDLINEISIFNRQSLNESIDVHMKKDSKRETSNILSKEKIRRSSNLWDVDFNLNYIWKKRNNAHITLPVKIKANTELELHHGSIGNIYGMDIDVKYKNCNIDIHDSFLIKSQRSVQKAAVNLTISNLDCTKEALSIIGYKHNLSSNSQKDILDPEDRAQKIIDAENNKMAEMLISEAINSITYKDDKATMSISYRDGKLKMGNFVIPM